jgi:hypothetical protein
MPARSSFWTNLEQDLQDPEYRRIHESEAQRIAEIDALINELAPATSRRMTTLSNVPKWMKNATVVQRIRWLAEGYEQTARLDSDAKVPLALVAAQIRACLDGDSDE